MYQSHSFENGVLFNIKQVYIFKKICDSRKFASVMILVLLVSKTFQNYLCYEGRQTDKCTQKHNLLTQVINMLIIGRVFISSQEEDKKYSLLVTFQALIYQYTETYIYSGESFFCEECILINPQSIPQVALIWS